MATRTVHRPSRLRSRWPVVLLVFALLIGCTGPTPATAVPAAEPTARPGESPSSRLREIVILRTNDEHGHLLPTQTEGFVQGGAGQAAADWLGRGYDPRASGGPVLLLSGGDNWVGPAISTWFKGEPTIEVMNAMGYAASVLGNHEFDFGQEVLRERLAQAAFPYLAANVYVAGSDRVADLVQPYALLDVNGVRLGLIGLALAGTPSMTAADNVAGLTFGDYDTALRRWVPIVRNAGAQVIVVETHICPTELALLSARVRDLGIDVFEGGHCHETRVMSASGARLNTASAYWRDYVITRLVYDLDGDEMVQADQELVDVLYPTSVARPVVDVHVDRIIDKWSERADLALGEVIAYTTTGLAQHSPKMHSLLVNSWLWAYPNAAVAISNVGGFREGLAPGEITLGDVVGAFPFENELYELTLQGQDLLGFLAASRLEIVVGGLKTDSQGRVTMNDGSPLDPGAAYRVLTTDYMYHNAKYHLGTYDRDPYETSILWRQPVIDWLRAQRSTAQHPVEDRIDSRATF